MSWSNKPGNKKPNLIGTALDGSEDDLQRRIDARLSDETIADGKPPADRYRGVNLKSRPKTGFSLD